MPKTTRKTGRLTVDIYSLPASALPALIAAIPLEGDVSISISVEEAEDEPTAPTTHVMGGPLAGTGPLIGDGMGPGSAPYVINRDAIAEVVSAQINSGALDPEHGPMGHPITADAAARLQPHLLGQTPR